MAVERFRLGWTKETGGIFNQLSMPRETPSVIKSSALVWLNGQSPYGNYSRHCMLSLKNGNPLFVLLTLTSLSTHGCSSFITSAQTGTATEYSQRCVPEIAKTQPDRAVAQVKNFIPARPSLRVEKQFSPEALRIAETIDVLALLNQLTDLRATEPTNLLKMLTRRQ